MVYCDRKNQLEYYVCDLCDCQNSIQTYTTGSTGEGISVTLTAPPKPDYEDGRTVGRPLAPITMEFKKCAK